MSLNLFHQVHLQGQGGQHHSHYHHYAAFWVCGKNILRMLFLRCFLLRIYTPSLIPGERQLGSKHTVSYLPCMNINDLSNFSGSSPLDENHAYVSACLERAETSILSIVDPCTPTWHTQQGTIAPVEPTGSKHPKLNNITWLKFKWCRSSCTGQKLCRLRYHGQRLFWISSYGIQ